ncbi:MAG: LysR family transcriptional regulator [Amylibacter sp.]|nr:LysR family transcriptional regulator [Amylibacter sp.]
MGSFTKAGEKLGMAQPSVSRFIHNLETSIGLALFERNHNRIKLTKEGKTLFDAVTLGLDHISGTVTSMQENASEVILTIGCTHGFSHMWLQERFVKIQGALPHHKVQIVTTDHTNPLTHEEVNCAIRLGDGNWPDCDARFLFAEQVFPVCTPEFAHNNNIMNAKKITPQKLQNLPLLVQDAGIYGWLGWRDWFAYHGVSYQFEADQKPINNYAFILQAAMEGKGIALMWEGLDAPYLERRWLIELGQLRVCTGNAYYLTFPKNYPYTDAISQVFT